MVFHIVTPCLFSLPHTQSYRISLLHETLPTKLSERFHTPLGMASEKERDTVKVPE